jgi:hypothetical protein
LAQRHRSGFGLGGHVREWACLVADLWERWNQGIPVTPQTGH